MTFLLPSLTPTDFRRLTLCFLFQPICSLRGKFGGDPFSGIGAVGPRIPAVSEHFTLIDRDVGCSVIELFLSLYWFIQLHGSNSVPNKLTYLRRFTVYQHQVHSSGYVVSIAGCHCVVVDSGDGTWLVKRWPSVMLSVDTGELVMLRWYLFTASRVQRSTGTQLSTYVRSIIKLSFIHSYPGIEDVFQYRVQEFYSQKIAFECEMVRSRNIKY